VSVEQLSALAEAADNDYDNDDDRQYDADSNCPLHALSTERIRCQHNTSAKRVHSESTANELFLPHRGFESQSCHLIISKLISVQCSDVRMLLVFTLRAGKKFRLCPL